MQWGEGKRVEPIGVIEASGFFPAVDGDAFCAEYMIPAELSSVVVMAHLKRGYMWACNQLSAYEISSSCSTLAEEQQQLIGDEGVYILAFNRAVCCWAKAEILLETASVVRRKEAENLAKSGESTEERYREFANDALRIILEMGSSVGVDLI